MTAYNRQYYSDHRIQTPTPGHQPIYGQVPLNWIANLTTQVAPRNLKDPGVASPLLIGVASKSGAIIESYWGVSLGQGTTGGGGYQSGGGGAANWGTGTAEDPVLLNIYTRREPDDEVYFIVGAGLYGAGGVVGDRLGFLILPLPERAWRLEPGQEVYVALSRPIPSPGINILFTGMHYS